MHRSFEPNRLSPTFLAQAYEKVIPQYVRVIHFETENSVEQDEEDQAGQARRAS